MEFQIKIHWVNSSWLYGSEFLVRRKQTDVYFILSIKRILDRMGWGAPFMIKYQSLIKKYIVTGWVDSQAFQVSSYLFNDICHRVSRLSGLSGLWLFIQWYWLVESFWQHISLWYSADRQSPWTSSWLIWSESSSDFFYIFNLSSFCFHCHCITSIWQKVCPFI